MGKDIEAAIKFAKRHGFRNIKVPRDAFKLSKDLFSYAIQASIEKNPKSKMVYRFQAVGYSVEGAYRNLETKIIKYVQDYVDRQQESEEEVVRKFSTLFSDAFNWLSHERMKDHKLRLKVEEKTTPEGIKYGAYVTKNGKKRSTKVIGKDEERVKEEACKRFMARYKYRKYIHDKRVEKFLIDNPGTGFL